MSSVTDKFIQHHSGPDYEPRSCPAKIADLILQILQTGIVSARSAGWSNDAELATIEADHIHNLPDLLRRYNQHKIKYYWKSERPSYIFKHTRQTGKKPMLFQEHWDLLEPLVPKE